MTFQGAEKAQFPAQANETRWDRVDGTGDGSMSRFFLTRLLWGSKMRWGDGNAKNREKEKRHRDLPCDAAGNQSSAIV